MKPKLILTDEIKASLDYENTENLMDLLFDLNKENGLTVITSTHDFEVAKSHNRIIESKGRLLNGILRNDFFRNYRIVFNFFRHISQSAEQPLPHVPIHRYCYA